MFNFVSQTNLRPTLLAFLAIIITTIISSYINSVSSSSEVSKQERIQLNKELILSVKPEYGSFLASRYAESIGDFTSAASYITQLLDQKPNLKGVTQRGHLILIRSGRIREAAILAARIVSKDKTDPLSNITLATVAIKKRSYDEALVWLEQIPQKGFYRLVIPLMRAWAFAGQLKENEALEVLAKLNEINGIEKITNLHTGLIADSLGNQMLASQAYIRTINNFDNPSFQLIRAYVGLLSRKDKNIKGKRLLEDYVEKNSQNLLVEPLVSALRSGPKKELGVLNFTQGASEALFSVAGLLNAQNYRAQSLTMLRLSLYLRPEDPSVLFLLGEVLNKENQQKQAIEVYNSIDHSDPYWWYARLNLARVYRKMGSFEKSITILRKMIRERPNRSDASREMGDALRVHKRYREAVQAYDLTENRSSTALDWRLLYSRGIALERMNDWKRAEQDLLNALRLKPDQPYILNYLGYSWIDRGMNLEGAKSMIEKAVSIRPNDGFIIDSLGWAFFQLGKYNQAVKYLEKAASLEPEDPVINDHLGDAYWLTNRRLEARFQWLRSLSQNPMDQRKELIGEKLRGNHLPLIRLENNDNGI